MCIYFPESRQSCLRNIDTIFLMQQIQRDNSTEGSLSYSPTDKLRTKELQQSFSLVVNCLTDILSAWSCRFLQLQSMHIHPVLGGSYPRCIKIDNTLKLWYWFKKTEALKLNEHKKNPDLFLETAQQKVKRRLSDSQRTAIHKSI